MHKYLQVCQISTS